jgi:hypothetical protein
LHHDRDTSDGLGPLFLSSQTDYSATWVADHHSNRRVAYGFIHGNWALDSARPDGRFCGVNDEITILHETGCYADFTQPAARMSPRHDNQLDLLRRR